MKRTFKVIISVLAVICCICLCACGAANTQSDSASSGAQIASTAETVTDKTASGDRLTPDEDTSKETSAEKSAADTLKEADELIKDKKYEEAMDLLTSDEQYRADSELNKIYNRIEKIERLTKGEVKPAPVNGEKATREIELTKDNFWDYFENRTIYVKDPFGKPSIYDEVVVLKEEYASKIAYEQDFTFYVRYKNLSSCTNYYTVDPDTGEMSFLCTRHFRTSSSSSNSYYFNRYSNNNFYFADCCDYSLYDTKQPIDYETYIKSDLPKYLLSLIGAYDIEISDDEYKNRSDVFAVQVQDYDILEVKGSILLYE